jgi:hypothetical protein
MSIAILRIRSRSSRSPRTLLLLLAIFGLAAQARAVELKPETASAFDRYVAAAEARMQAEIQRGAFLFPPIAPFTGQAEAQLRAGKILVARVNARAEGKPIAVPGGLVHDWVGAIFLPGVSLAQTLAVVQNYNRYQDFYRPAVRRSELRRRNGDRFQVFLQLYKRSLVTVAIDGDFDDSYQHFGPAKAQCSSHATRLAEVADVGQPGEHELSPQHGHGYLWRLNTYWRLEQQDGGVYLQIESIGLSRNVPAVIGWLVDPLLDSIPRGTLAGLLRATRAAVLDSGSRAATPR